MECHDCRTGLESDTACFSPGVLDKYIRCLKCWKVAMDKEGIPYKKEND